MGRLLDSWSDARPSCWVCGEGVDMGERACASCMNEARALRRTRCRAPERLQGTPAGQLCGCDDCNARRGYMDVAVAARRYRRP